MQQKVKISKIAHLDDAIHSAPPMHEYAAGQDNGNVSLPVEYWLEGFFEQEPEVGKSVIVNRTSRNGEQIGGIFMSSTVTEVTKNGFKTMNSVYTIEYI